MIACLDAHYHDSSARAACVLIEGFSDPWPAASYAVSLPRVHPYEPGRFFLRELPCLMAVLALVPMMPRLLIVDAYVWLSAESEPGLGAHLHAAVEYAAPVIGVAKTEFMSLHGSRLVERVYRGNSRRPLFVTSVGVDLPEAGARIRDMHGPHRIPDALRLVDRLARTATA